jgi:hypothetical protein
VTNIRQHSLNGSLLAGHFLFHIYISQKLRYTELVNLEQDQMSNEKILEKIQKLLNMSTSSNEHEAALALERVTELLEKYNLTMTEVKRAEVGEVFVRSMHSVSIPKDFEAWLADLIAKAFGMVVLWRPGNSNLKDYWGRYTFIGPKHQLPLVEYTFTVLQRQQTKQRQQFSVRLKEKCDSAGITLGSSLLTKELDGFAKGWVLALKPKVHAFVNDPEIQETIDEYVKATINGKEVEPDNRGTGYFGFDAGTKAGASVDIHRPMNQGKTNLIGG